MPRIASAKTLADQVTEIEKLIFDAQQTLSQASYALETLQDRIARLRLSARHTAANRTELVRRA